MRAGSAGVRAARGAVFVWLGLLTWGACGEPAPPAESPPEVPREPAPAPLGNPDAGEGAKAKREEGKVGKREASVDLQVAENAGVLGSYGSGELTGAVGGLVGASGTAVGAGGLGARGSGIGGGGAAFGLGAGMGSGSSGYGVGGGNFGAKGAPDAPSREQYTDYGVSDFVVAGTDRVSTFSVDVDTGSYTIARRKLREGALPPSSSVRTEEFVNYLDYRYAPPAGDALFAVHGELAPHPFAPSHRLLRVGLKGKELPTANRPPMHLTFLVDVSGSMSSPDKLPLAQQALHYLVDQLGPEDTVAIATYAGGQRRVLEPTPTTRARLVHDAIDSLRSGGGTAMESGMVLAYDMAHTAFLRGAENRVIVLSDGDANIGSTSHEDVLRTISTWAGQGITLSTVGFGTGNYRDTLMEQLADEGDGNYSYIDSLQEAKRVFGTNFAGTLRTVARDVKVQVEFDPAAVLSYRLVGYENRDIADEDFRDDKVDAGEVGSGHEVTALYDLVLTDAASGPIATVRLRAKPPGEDAAAREWTYAVERGDTLTFDSAGADLRLAFGVASFAELLRGSPHTGEMTWDDVLRIVKRSIDPENADHVELVELVERARALSAGAIPVAGR